MSESRLHQSALSLVNKGPGSHCIAVSRGDVSGTDVLVIAAAGPGSARLHQIVRNAAVAGIIGGGKHTFSDYYLFALARNHG
jgi:hypothetical protein